MLVTVFTYSLVGYISKYGYLTQIRVITNYCITYVHLRICFARVIVYIRTRVYAGVFIYVRLCVP